MQRPTAQLVPLVVLGLVVLAVSRASGEPFLDLYGGIADTESTRVTATDRNCTTVFPFLLDVCSPETKATRNVGFETSATYGVRGGYWFEPVPWVGLAGDLSYFEAEAPAARFRVVPLSLLVMLRLPLLATEEIPKGRLQPYVGLGPSIFFHEATVDFRDEGVRKVRLSSAELGFDARLGLAWQFSPASRGIRRVPLHPPANFDG